MLWFFRRANITVEQAVYGSFPFSDRGYHLLGHSEGCRPTWRSALIATCQRLGERPRDASPFGGLFTQWLDDGTWMVVRPSSRSADDHGRPDAACFHGLFLGKSQTRRLSARPDSLRSGFREDWGPRDSALGPVTIRPGPAEPSVDMTAEWPVESVVEALGAGKRVIVEAEGPIDSPARSVWERLSKTQRRRLTLATWVFNDSGVFDLLAMPRLTGIDLDDPGLHVIRRVPEGSLPLNHSSGLQSGIVRAADERA